VDGGVLRPLVPGLPRTAAELECVPSVVKYKVNTENTARPGRANKRKAEEELLDPEEDEKRSMRRNRNRLAAARCRQKRLDQIETLQVEVNNWELKNRSLEEEVVALKAEKEELQYILAAHRSTCALQVKVEPATEEETPVFVQVQPCEETVKPQRPSGGNRKFPGGGYGGRHHGQEGGRGEHSAERRALIDDLHQLFELPAPRGAVL